MIDAPKRVLVVSPPTFGNAVGGAAKDIFEIVRLLKDMGHAVSFYAIGSLGQDEKVIEAFKKTYGVSAQTFLPTNERRNWVEAVLRDWALLDGAAYVFRQLVQDKDFLSHVETFKPDTIVHFCSYSWPVAQFAKERGISAVFRSHNYEPSFFWEELESVGQWNPLNWIRYAAKRRGEWNAVRFTNSVATIPFADIWRYRAWKPERIFPLTLTYLPQSLRTPHMHEGKEPLDVFYLGASYRVSFHLRGAAMLIEDIAPRVLSCAPGRFRFHVCGAKLPQYLVEKCDGKNIIYEGYVPDLEKFLDRMDIGAFPVFTGKVMKGKVFESLARGFPIVIPRVCMAEYTLEHGEEVLLAETVDEFVEAIVSLENGEKRAALARGAVRFANKHFSHEALTASLSKALTAALS